MTTSVARNRLYAAIHVAAKAHGLDDDTRRDLIEVETGHRSAKDCTDAELVRVLDRLNGKATDKGKHWKPSRRPEVRKIFALWGELKLRGALTSPTKGALRAFCARMALTGGAATDPEFLTPAQARVVIEALKAWIDRTATS